MGWSCEGQMTPDNDRSSRVNLDGRSKERVEVVLKSIWSEYLCLLAEVSLSREGQMEGREAQSKGQVKNKHSIGAG